MYYIGPLLFWACAEMTCGFFIFSVPCLSRVIAESGLSRKVKSTLGISAESTSPSNENWTSSRSRNKPLETSNEGDIPMGNTTDSESQVHLCDDSYDHHPWGVKRTMDIDITVATESHPSGLLNDNTANISPWKRRGHSIMRQARAW